MYFVQKENDGLNILFGNGFHIYRNKIKEWKKKIIIWAMYNYLYFITYKNKGTLEDW